MRDYKAEKRTNALFYAILEEGRIDNPDKYKLFSFSEEPKYKEKSKKQADKKD